MLSPASGEIIEQLKGYVRDRAGKNMGPMQRGGERYWRASTRSTRCRGLLDGSR
jgi:hypothetical protein